ncbi:MAG: PIN domain-containing protein [Alphaproteobacteria bacterium]|nr:PIN domain-containing protein [Alphaproteobacteria bacterium]MBM3952621.1 PIN domain-containing protein [Rhodospirillales bacterium]
MFVVDTNVLIDAADRDSPFHAPCRKWLETWRNQTSAWFLTLGVCYEFMRVVTHRRALKQPWSATDAWSFVSGILASPGVSLLAPTERHARVAEEVFAETPGLSGNIIHDAATAVLMREHGLRTIYSRDADFHRFRFLEVIDPTA